MKYPAAKKMKIKSVLETSFEQDNKIHIIGRISSKRELQSYKELVLNDGSGEIRSKAFGKSVDANENELIRVIGRVQKDEQGKFVSGEIIKKIADPRYSELWELETKATKEPSFIEDTGSV